MNGTIVTLAWLLWEPMTGKDFPDKAIWILLAVCFVVASFRLWLKDHMLIESMTGLSGEITQSYAGDNHASNPTAAFVFLSLVITNRGEPTIAYQWEVSTKLINEKEIPCEILLHDKENFINVENNVANIVDQDHEKNNASNFGLEDSIIKKGTVPIQKGGLISGCLILVYQGKSWSEVGADGVRYTVSFKDVYGNKYSCSRLMGRKSQPSKVGMKLEQEMGNMLPRELPDIHK